MLVLVDHFLWFQYFTTTRYFVFVDVAAFFGICVWLIPFAYFISLSANDNALPSFGLLFYYYNADMFFIDRNTILNFVFLK